MSSSLSEVVFIRYPETREAITPRSPGRLYRAGRRAYVRVLNLLLVPIRVLRVRYQNLPADLSRTFGRLILGSSPILPEARLPLFFNLR
jgi:hypothetical protein